MEGRCIDWHPATYVGMSYLTGDRVWQKSHASSPATMLVFDGALECEMKRPDTASYLNQLRVEFPNLET